MNRPALLASVVLPLFLLACCTGASTTQPGPNPSPQQASAPAMTEPPPTTAATPRETGTPNPLPSIPPKLPNEIIRSTFGGDTVGNEVATHTFVGQVVSIHVLCASHEGSVRVDLMVDRVKKTGGSMNCREPQLTIEDSAFPAGTHEVSFHVEPRGGASGVAYLTEGDI